MRSPWLFVPPPPLFVASFAAGLVLGRLIPPHHLLPVVAAGVGRVLGVGVVALGIVVVIPAALLFLRYRTTIIPHSAAARVLVARGPFRVTRNPMYLGLTIVYAGAALVTNAAWPLALLALPLWVMDARVIPYEEGNLERTFGESYRQYRARVRRWL